MWINWIISKTHHSIWNIHFVLGADEHLEKLEDKIRKYLFFYVKIFWNNSVYCRSMVLLSSALDHLGMEQPWVIRLEPYHSLKLKMDFRWTNTWDHGLQLFFGFVAFLLQLVALYQGPVHLPFPKQFENFFKIFPSSTSTLWNTTNHTG